MIDMAVERAEQAGIGNVRFQFLDWHKADLAKVGFEKKFDLVIARMPPAVQSADTFQKLSLAGKGWCVMSKPTRRTDSISDKVKNLIGVTEKRESSDTDILYAFGILWLEGLQPHINYEPQRWSMEKTLEEAYGLYINRVKTYRDITAEEEQKIKTYLQSVAKDGIVYENVATTITTIYWHV